MINLETDKWMEAVREAATVVAWSKDNEERVRKLEREVSWLEDLASEKDEELKKRDSQQHELKLKLQDA